MNLSEIDSYDDSVTEIYRFHPSTGYVFTPNNTFVAGHPGQRETPTIKIDRHGFLSDGNDVELKKEDNEIRIATIGASTTANINLSFDENWPGRLRSKLQQKFPGKKITLINAAVPGYDTSQSIGNLSLRVMPFKPDIVIIYHAYNDLKAISDNSEFKPDYSHIHGTPFGCYEKPPRYKLLLEKSMLYVRARNQYREISKLKRIPESHEDSKKLRIIPEQAKKTFYAHMRTLIAIAHSDGAKVIISSFATLHDPMLDYSSTGTTKGMTGLKRKELRSLMQFTPNLSLQGIFSGLNSYNKILKNVASELNTGWVDNANQVPHDERYFVDRVHFSSMGADRMSDNFLPEVERIIKDSLTSQVN